MSENVLNRAGPMQWILTKRCRSHPLRSVLGPYGISTGVVAVGVDPHAKTLRGGADVRRERYAFGW